MLATAKLACILAENLPVQVEQRRHGDAAQLLVPHPVTGETVFAASGDALRAGVEIGMSLYQARQIAPSALIVEPDEGEYHARHDAMRGALKAFSSAIEAVALGEFLIDVRGFDRAHGSDQQLAIALCDSARRASRLSIQIGLGAGKFVAQQAARHAPADGSCVIPPGDESRFVAPFPITVLPHLPGEMKRRLALLDIHTLGDLAALRKPAVLRQFGGEASVLYELARGHDPRPLQPDVPPLRIVRSMELSEPVTDRQVVLNVVNHLSKRLSRVLVMRGYHAEALKLTLEVGCTHPIRLEHGQALKPPTADEGRLCRLAMQMLGRLGVTSPVARVSLSAYPLRSWHHSAHQLALVKSGLPEKLARLEDIIQLILHRFGQAAIKIASLLGPPIPLKVKVRVNRDGLPSVVTLAGQMRGIVGVDEHWREERAWWSKPLRREYFRVILPDGSLRNLFQNLNDGEWYLDRAWPIL
jgi:DNA polymerase-4